METGQKKVYVFDLLDKEGDRLGNYVLLPSDEYYELRSDYIDHSTTDQMKLMKSDIPDKNTGRSVPGMCLMTLDVGGWSCLIFEESDSRLKNEPEYDTIRILSDLNGWKIERIATELDENERPY